MTPLCTGDKVFDLITKQQAVVISVAPASGRTRQVVEINVPGNPQSRENPSGWRLRVEVAGPIR